MKHGICLRPFQASEFCGVSGIQLAPGLSVEVDLTCQQFSLWAQQNLRSTLLVLPLKTSSAGLKSFLLAKIHTLGLKNLIVLFFCSSWIHHMEPTTNGSLAGRTLSTVPHEPYTGVSRAGFRGSQDVRLHRESR